MSDEATQPLQGRYDGFLDYHTAAQVDRLFLISLRRGYLFCPISKVANSTVKAVLYEAEMRATGYSRGRINITTAQVHDQFFGPLILPYQLERGRLQKIVSSTLYYKFIFVRHPIDRALSCYLDRIKTDGSAPNKLIRAALNMKPTADVTFSDFLGVIAEQSIAQMNPHWRPQYYEACANVIAYDQVYQFEDFADNMGAILERLYPNQIGNIDLSKNFSPRKTDARARRAELVSPDDARKLVAIYETDFENFGYE